MSQGPPVPDPRCALFLDLDGTLLDIAPRPELVAVPEGLAALLRRVERSLGGAVAVISGRPIEQLDVLLAPWHPAAAGEHGALCRLPGGGFASPDELPALPASWHGTLRRLAARHPGIVVETKHTSITVHFRLAPDLQSEVHRTLAGLAAGEGGAGFTLCPAHMAFELRPRGIDKGWAVRRLMREPPFVARVPIVVGDDVTDEDGFRAAEALGGKGLQVPRDFPRGAADVRAWLQATAEQIETLQQLQQQQQ